MRATQLLRSGGGKIPYALQPPQLPSATTANAHNPQLPKARLVAAGGWYGQPQNWKQNTAIMGGIIFGVCMVLGSISADREHRDRMPEPNRFFPSRYWSREIREHEAALKAQAAREGSS
ncbi:hypothetical protein Tdes44962_MAKER03721 [Teratosphaeria destructans]|uniref:Uncharacterized protein n=1 Tax=Teratosphaeria destructans TaxID=418781 RepID=A0A9W7SP13_9PEZI|nr:hypothetical protein Tdes44962_MAKER03721 [Teratosphaeria destructans]